MAKINIDTLKIGTEVFDETGELCHIYYITLQGMTFPQEHMIKIQHYPNSKWYKAEVKCDKCGGISTLTHTATIDEKLICGHKISKQIIPSNQLFPVEKFFTCGGKKYTEIKRRSTGIPCVNIYSWNDFIKIFKLN